jgi:hypothetical protein
MFVAARCLSCFNKKERSRVLTVRGFIMALCKKNPFFFKIPGNLFFFEKKI